MKTCLCLVYFLLLFCSVSYSEDPDCNEIKQSVFKCKSESPRDSIPVSKIENLVPPHATKLDLSKMKLSFSNGTFSNFNNLKTLNLSFAQLSKIPEKIFTGLVSLKTLDLSNNNIEMLSPSFFDDLDVNNVTLNLQKNKWNCNCHKGLFASLNKVKNIKLGPIPAMCDSPKIMKSTRIDQGCDHNECLEENDCDDMATCRNTAQSYACTCSTKGYEGSSGKECTDIDECLDPDTCSKNGAKCINTHGSYKCECKDGFTGNGRTCKDIDECETVDCGEDGECTNTAGSFSCDCDEGYVANDNHICVDIDECQSNVHTCDAIENSYCVNMKRILRNDPGFDCACESGYTKVGKSCVHEGSTNELLKILAMIIGGFFGILFLIIIFAVLCRKRRNREPEKEKEEESTVVVAPAVGMAPPVDFAYLEMPQTEQEVQELEGEEEWGELEEDDVE